jgi:ATP-dependent Zn protease
MMNNWSVNLGTIASRTTGMTGADMKNLVNLAILNAIKEKRQKAEMSDFEHALDRMLMGITRKSLTMDDRDKLLTSYHEAGHTLMNLLTNSGVDLHKATILPAGMSLGIFSQLKKPYFLFRSYSIYS